MDSVFQPINLLNMKSDGDLLEIDCSIGVRRSDIKLLPAFLLCYLDTVKEKNRLIKILDLRRFFVQKGNPKNPQFRLTSFKDMYKYV